MKKHLIGGIGLIAILWMVIGVKETWSIRKFIAEDARQNNDGKFVTILNICIFAILIPFPIIEAKVH